MEVMSRYCQACVQRESYKSKDVALYEKYKIDHDCTINLSDSAPAMEQVGVKRISGRSMDKINCVTWNIMAMVIPKLSVWLKM